jgi:hypothetical protein
MKPFDDAVKDGVVVVAGFDVADEVLATVLGAFSASSSRVMSPWLVVSLTAMVDAPVKGLLGSFSGSSFADSTMIGVAGTFWWKPALPVGTLPILRTTSMPFRLPCRTLRSHSHPGEG